MRHLSLMFLSDNWLWMALPIAICAVLAIWVDVRFIIVAMMVLFIVLPMVLGSLIDPWIIRSAAMEPTAEILAKYPSYAGSYLYPYELFLAAAAAAVFILIPARLVRRDARRIRAEKLEAMER